MGKKAKLETEEEEQVTAFVEIGLSRLAAMSYLALSLHGPLVASVIGYCVDAHRNSVYRCLRELKRKGFVTSLRVVGVTDWHAVPLTQALDDYAEYQWRLTKRTRVQQAAEFLPRVNTRRLPGPITRLAEIRLEEAKINRGDR